MEAYYKNHVQKASSLNKNGLNIFIIPSWYPSKDRPHAGIFNKEQAEALAQVFPESNFVLSSWGPNEEDLLLWGKDHLKNLHKIIRFIKKTPKTSLLSPNLTEYYSPTLTWSRKFLGGNIKRIIEINESHFLDFQKKKGKVDILHAHTAHPAGWVAMWLSRKYQIPYVITEHMGPFPFKDYLLPTGKLSKWLQKPFLNSSCNIAVSPNQEEVLKKWGIPHLKCIPNLTNEDVFKPALNQNIYSQEFTFFSLSAQIPVKGIPYLLEAFRLLVNKSKRIRLRIGGYGSEIQNYKRLAQKLQINDHVEWLGALTREEALKEFQQCQSFVLSSLHESMGVVYTEAIACGKPVIGTRCGGPESIINEKNGLLAEPGDSNSLYQAMEYMLHHSQDYKQEEIREDFINRYSRKVVCKQIMEVYKEVTDAYSKNNSNS